MNENNLIPRLVLEQWEAVDDHVKRAALEKALSTAPQWQPISTAPKDGTIFVGVVAGAYKKAGHPYRPSLVCWHDYGDGECGWLDPSQGNKDYVHPDWPLTHWMPLAELPATEETEE